MTCIKFLILIFKKNILAQTLYYQSYLMTENCDISEEKVDPELAILQIERRLGQMAIEKAGKEENYIKEFSKMLSNVFDIYKHQGVDKNLKKKPSARRALFSERQELEQLQSKNDNFSGNYKRLSAEEQEKIVGLILRELNEFTNKFFEKYELDLRDLNCNSGEIFSKSISYLLGTKKNIIPQEYFTNAKTEKIIPYKYKNNYIILISMIIHEMLLEKFSLMFKKLKKRFAVKVYLHILKKFNLLDKARDFQLLHILHKLMRKEKLNANDTLFNLSEKAEAEGKKGNINYVDNGILLIVFRKFDLIFLNTLNSIKLYATEKHNKDLIQIKLEMQRIAIETRKKIDNLNIKHIEIIFDYGDLFDHSDSYKKLKKREFYECFEEFNTFFESLPKFYKPFEAEMRKRLCEKN